ncbi:hypothetical protein BG015_011863 [Linnemannia schmuckeri]|uniref:Uncharacterized protein n=1 Tax=Linnemannia schmuckeri TaxID=64567 RepID=A0A9P5VE65_9FUNG|nr:hypothetical protein BG015_011863 [Linnemannia schmuckeri]
MFLSWSFFEVYILFFFFHILLSAALRTGLAFYSKSRGGHTHSLRWVQQGGHVELGKIFWNTMGRGLPSSQFRPLVVVIALSAFLEIVNIAANALVKESVQGTNPSHELVKTTEFISLDTISTLAGWSATVSFNSSLSDSLLRTINSTLNIPDAIPNRVYTPRKYPYEVACTNFDLIMLDKHTDLYPNLLSSNNGCAILSLAPINTMTINKTATVITRRSNSSVKVVMPGPYDFQDGTAAALGFQSSSVSISVVFGDLVNKCATSIIEGMTISSSASGITSAPFSSVTKCVFPSGQVISLSVTAVRYSVPDLKSFGSISSSVLQSSRAPVLAMQNSITDGTLSNLTASPLDGISVMEIQFSGSRVDLLTCASRRAGHAGPPYLACLYSVVTAIASKPQPMLPEIAALRGADKPISVLQKMTSIFPVNHLPLINGTESNIFSVSQILDDSSSAAYYVASLGQNFFMDWDDGGLYTVFDTVDLTKGYELPGWLFGSVVAIMAVSLLLGIVAEITLDSRYKGSLLWALTKEIQPHLGRSTPTLIRVKPDTLTVEGFRLVDSVNLLDSTEQ